MKKYEFINDTKVINGHTLYRIVALRNFGLVDKGDLGGYIEKEDNLSHKGNCWVYDDAKVYGNAEIYDDAEVHGNAQIYGNAEIYNDRRICGDEVIGNWFINYFL